MKAAGLATAGKGLLWMRILLITNNPQVHEYAYQKDYEFRFIVDSTEKVLYFGRNLLLVGWRSASIDTLDTQLVQAPFLTLVLDEGRGDRLYLQDIMRFEKLLLHITAAGGNIPKGKALEEASNQDFHRTHEALLKIHACAS